MDLLLPTVMAISWPISEQQNYHWWFIKMPQQVANEYRSIRNGSFSAGIVANYGADSSLMFKSLKLFTLATR